MQRYLVTRLLHATMVILVVATVTFGLLQFAPGGPSVLVNPDLSPEDAALLKAKLGLDQPLHVQYGRWLFGVVQLDLGSSFTYGRPVATLISERLPATLLLGVVALLLAVAVAIPLGVLAARHQSTWIDRVSTLFTLLGISVPPFWLGIVLILVLSVGMRALPSSGMVTAGKEFSMVDLAQHLVMPSLVLGLLTMAQVAKYTRSSLLGVLRQDYLRTARAKGLRERTVLARHALRNALVPVVTVVGLLLPRLVGGAVVTETIFAWPGIGRLAMNAAYQRDYPVVMGITLMISVVVVLGNLVIDMLYAYLDPRIRLG